MTKELLQQAELALSAMLYYQSSRTSTTIHEYGHARRTLDMISAAIAQPVRVGSPNLLQPATGLDLLAEVRRLRGVLESIAGHGVPYHDDFDGTASLSDFGGNADDYAFHLKSINDALIGDIARAAIASLPKEK